MKHKFHTPPVLVLIVIPTAFILFVLFAFVIDNNKPLKNNQQKVESSTPTHNFTMVTVPGTIYQPTDRMVYLASHYWDNFNFHDTTYLHTTKVAEQAFINYIEILLNTDKQTTNNSIKTLLNQAQKEKSGTMYEYFIQLFKKYLYEPNSFLRNDELYIPVAEYIIDDKTTNYAEKERAKFQLEMMTKNRIGETATDFKYTLSSGKTGALHQLKSDYILLLFYNPDCHACEATITSIKTSNIIQKYLDNKDITILSIYPDADINIWEKHLNDIPPKWINGYDRQMVIQNKRLYDLKAIPSLYLLDANKNVMLKDTELILIEQYLENEQNINTPK